MQTRPRPTLRYDHTAIAARDNAPVRDFFLDLLGGVVDWNNWTDADPPTFYGVQTLYEDTMLEIITPGNATSFVNTFLDKYGPGLHHITWKVDALDEFIAGLQERGVPLTGLVRHKGRVVNAFTRPAYSHGVLMQFRPAYEWNQQMGPDNPGKQNLPPPRTPRGRIQATAIAVPDGKEASAFFQSVLGGEITPEHVDASSHVQSLEVGENRLDFYWPLDGDGLAARHLRESGPGMHHLTFKLSKFDEAIEAAQALGVQLKPVNRSLDDVFVLKNNPASTLLRLQRA